MVAPSLSCADSHSKDDHTHSSVHTPLKAGLEKRNPDAVCFENPASTIDSSSEEGSHDNYCNGDTRASANYNHDQKIIKETQNDVEKSDFHGSREGTVPKVKEDNFGSWENDAICQEPATEFARRAHSMGTTQQPTELIVDESINAVCAPKGKQVQWNDNHGKELVHVYEYIMRSMGQSRCMKHYLLYVDGCTKRE